MAIEIHKAKYIATIVGNSRHFRLIRGFDQDK
jgi:hypothetical protein